MQGSGVRLGRDLQTSLAWFEHALARHREVVRGMSAIRLADCPSDFQSAYVDHTQAWTEKTDALARMQSSVIQLAALAAQAKRTACCANEPTAQHIRAEVQSAAAAKTTAVRAIQETWIDLRKASLRYGVEPRDFDVVPARPR